ncbi:F-actin-monooxygenase MICAL3 isoform X2 [Orussus abietinus]|uniref:F-actin-monooxygenase MICAL3 isoform X2 n=1 Tax=Orussus abietinus TaxID=222816 RepID=UPI00062610A1|nr:F-actin-monooxygenase MICAL3 isoform X2 [Orussus abietinus]
MPASQPAASERRNDRMTTHEPPKLKTTLKTPPKQATNPLQFVKVGPCSLYRTAQEQLQKVQEVKKIKQEVRDDPEDWQSNLDNWKSSRRKRQEHIIERVVEVKKLELEEHDRQRRRSKTFSEMMEERGNRGRKLSISLAVYHEEDSNDLSDLGIGTSSGKSSVSGDTHDDTHSVLSDRDSEIEKNHSDVENTANENGSAESKKPGFENGFHGNHNHQEYDSATTATTSSPEPEEYTYEGAIRGYVSRVSQNIPRRSLASLDGKLESAKSAMNGSKSGLLEEKGPAVKVDILKRREIFEKGTQKGTDGKTNRPSGDFAGSKSIKERLSSLERQKYEAEEKSAKASNRLSGDMSTIRERLSHLEKQATERESKSSLTKLAVEDVDVVRPLRERLSTLEKYSSSDESSAPGSSGHEIRHNGELSAKSIKDRLCALDSVRNKEAEKRPPGKHGLCFGDNETGIETSTPSERSSSPDSEYRAPRAAFHRSLDSLDADASSGPDTFERVQSLEELDYGRRYPASSSSAELLNDTDREDSGIHTADVSCSVSQADEPVDEEIVHANAIAERQELIEEKPESAQTKEIHAQAKSEETKAVSDVEPLAALTSQSEAAGTRKGTAEPSGELSTNTSQPQTFVEVANVNSLRTSTSSRPVVYQSPRVPPRRTPPEIARPKPVAASHKVPSELSPPKTSTESKLPIPCSPEGSSSSDQSSPNDSVDRLVQESCRRPTTKDKTSPPSLSSEDLKDLQEDLPPLLESPESPAALTPTFSYPNTEATGTSNPASPTTSQEPKTPTTPSTPSPRSSKIPTPLPRKTALGKTSSTSSSPSSSTPSTPSSPQPIPVSPKPRTGTKIPGSIAKASSSTLVTPSTDVPSPFTSARSSSPSSSRNAYSLPTSPSTANSQPLDAAPSSPSLPIPSTESPAALEERPADRRRTVVEVCEKVVVPLGEAPPTLPVTPFITVARVESDGSFEEQIVMQKTIQESNREIPLSVEKEERKMTEVTIKPEGNPVPRKDSKEALKVPEDLKVSPSLDRPTLLILGKSEPPDPEGLDFPSPGSPMSKQILPLNLSDSEEMIAGLAFPLGPPTSVEPPKEKPPPPPLDLSDEESVPVEPLKRLNSTRRIKKELRTRRSDFLGIEGVNDDDLERELTLAKPPDMAAILAEERRIEQLHRRSFDTDSNYEQDSSHERDSGVELGHAEDWTKQPISPDMSQHSRQSSEPFGASVTSSEEDEITKKEREIIGVLEKEEQWRYGNNCDPNRNSDIGEKLAHKLRELEEEKMQLERERAQEVELRRQETLRKNEENIRKQEDALRKQQKEVARQQETARAEAEARCAEEKRQEEELRIQTEQMRIQTEIEEKERRALELRRQEELRIRAIESQIREQETKTMMGAGLSNREDEFASGEVLRVERELLQLEQEELKRQRSNLAYREQKQQQLAEQLQEQWKSLQDVAHVPSSNTQQFKQLSATSYRSSMPNLQLQDGQRRRPPPPPIPPAKPLRLAEQRQRDVTIRNSRIPSADSIPQQVDPVLRHSASATTLATHAGQQMTRQTLQALSAVPRPRIVQGDQWVQRRKSDIPRGARDFNYQHWLIQEAEQRRINEKNQRSPLRKSQPHVTGTSVPYTAVPPRSDSKPLPDSIIQTLTQRVQNRAQEKPLPPRRRLEHSTSQEHLPPLVHQSQQQHAVQQQKVQSSTNGNVDSQEKMLSVSGKKKCSHCGDELGRGAAMIIESLRLFYHMECFKCCVCHVRLGDGLMGTDVRVRNHKLHCHNCYSSDDGTHA